MVFDPSQFALNPSAAQSGALSRRLMAGINPNTPTDYGSKIAPPAFNPIQEGGLGATRPLHNGQPNGFLPHMAPLNPLIGGSGNPDLDKYLGTDSTYQSQLSDLMHSYDQALAQKNLTSSQTQADYDAKTRALDLQAEQDRLDMRNSAAARGILQSGVYANQLGQYNTTNQTAMTNLLDGLQNAKDTAGLQWQQFVANEIAAKNKAIQDAAARRAAALAVF